MTLSKNQHLRSTPIPLHLSIHFASRNTQDERDKNFFVCISRLTKCSKDSLAGMRIARSLILSARRGFMPSRVYRKMKRVKKNNSPGFTLVETIVALLVIGLVIGTLFQFQGQLLKGTFRARTSVERILSMKNALVKAQKELWFKEKSKKYTDETYATEIVYTASEPAGNSSLKSIKNLTIEKIEARSPGLTTGQKSSLISFVYRQEP